MAGSRITAPARPATGSSNGGGKGRIKALPCLAAAALIVLTAIPYLGSLQHPMLHDDRTLLDNGWLRNEAAIDTVFHHHYWHGSRHPDSDLYRPVTILTLAWNLHADAPRIALRLSNLVLHCCVVFLAWRMFWIIAVFLRERSGKAGDEALPDAGRRMHIGAWSGAALFAVHPLAGEAVFFAVGRGEILAALFGMAAFLCLIDHGAAHRYRLLFISASPVLFFLALCSKESAAAWLPLLALWYFCSRPAASDNRVILIGAFGWVLSFTAFLLLRGKAVGWSTIPPHWIDNPLVLEGHFTRAANAVLLHATYLGKMLWPRTLSAEFGFAQIPVIPLFPWALIFASLAVTIWACIAVAMKRTTPAALFLWIFIPVAFIVTGNFLFPIGTIFAGRLAYLPLVAFCGLAGLFISRVSNGSVATALILAVLLGSAAMRTGVRAGDMKDHTTFVEATAAESPSAVKALYNAARSRLRRGDAAGAVEYLRRAIKIWPEYRRALYLLAEAYDALGEHSSAEKYRTMADGIGNEP